MRERYFSRSLIKAGLVVVVLLALLVVTAPLFSGGVSPRGIRGASLKALSKMKQLHLVMQQMDLDREATGNTNVGWPGDLGGSFVRWADAVVPEYLSTNEFAQLLSLPGKVGSPGVLPRGNTNGILVYAVGSNSPYWTVMLSTANFTNTAMGGVAPRADAVPYGDKGFVVFQKGGNGALLYGRSAGRTNLVGAFAPLCE